MTLARAATQVLLLDKFRERDGIYDPTAETSTYRYGSQPTTPPFPAEFVPVIDGRYKQKKRTIFEKADRFTVTYPVNIYGTLDHAKKLTSTDAFDLCVGCTIRAEYKAAGWQRHAGAQPFGDYSSSPQEDLRLGFASFELFNEEKGLFFVFAMTDHAVYAFYERIPDLMNAVSYDLEDAEGDVCPDDVRYGSCTCADGPDGRTECVPTAVPDTLPEGCAFPYPSDSKVPSGVYCPPWYSFTTAKKIYEKRRRKEKVKVAVEITRGETATSATWYLDDHEVLHVPRVAFLPDDPELGIICERNGDPDSEANAVDLTEVRIGFNLLNALDFADVPKVTEEARNPGTYTDAELNTGLLKVSSLRNLYTKPTTFLDDNPDDSARLWGGGAASELDSVKVTLISPDDDEKEQRSSTSSSTNVYKPPSSSNDYVHMQH